MSEPPLPEGFRVRHVSSPAPLDDLGAFRLGTVRHLLREELGATSGTLADLGAGPCLFSRLARDEGLTVTAIDARVERRPDDGRLDGIAFLQADVRSVDLAGFDIVFVLGLLYHLSLADQRDLLRRASTARAVIVDTQVHDPWLVRDRPEPWETDLVTVDGLVGVLFPERDTLQAGWQNATSFWPTEPSLLALAAETGYREAVLVDPRYLTHYGARRTLVLYPHGTPA